MKYNFNLNQIKMIEWELKFSEAILIDLFVQIPTWADAEVIDGEVWYFFSKNKILDEAPCLSKSGKIDTIYKQAKGLQEKGFVTFKKIGRKDYWKLENKIKEWSFENSEKNPNFETNSEKNPSKLGKKSELNSEKNPTYNNTILDNNTSIILKENEKEKISIEEKKEKQKQVFINMFKIEIVKDEQYVKGLLDTFGVSKQEFLSCAEDFHLRWTESTATGIGKWEKQPTFEIRKRFYTRLKKNSKFSSKSRKKFVAVSEDDELVI